MPRFVDLSIYLENDVLSDPPPLAPKIEYRKHHDTLPEFMKLIPGTKEDDYPDREAAAAEWVHATTHSGTHLDAPWHFHSTMDAKFGGPKPSITIDQVPLDWCFRPGVKLDFRDRPDGYVVHAGRRRSGARAHRPRSAAARHRSRQYARRVALRARRLRQRRLRHGLRGHDVPAGARRAADGHRRLELGRAVLVHGEEVRRDRRQAADLGRSQGGPRNRLLPPGEAAQPRGAAGRRLHHLLLPAQDPRRLGGLDARGGDLQIDECVRTTRIQ